MFEKALSFAAGVILLASVAAASTLVPGTAPSAPSTFAPNWTLLATTGLLSNLPSGPPATFTGEGQAWVYSDANNVYGAGDLDFVYQFTNNGPHVNERLTAFNFTGFSVDAGYIVGTGIAPSAVSLSSDGAVVGFAYLPTNLMAGQSTDLLIVETNATTYVPGTYTVQDGSTLTTLGFSPALAPEPASVALIGAGLLGLSLLRRRSSQR